MTRFSVVAIFMFLTVVTATFGQSPEKEKVEPKTVTAPIGGPVDIFTVYDGTTIRKGEFTFSAAYSNYDKDEPEILPLLCRSEKPSVQTIQPAETFDRFEWPLERKFFLYKPNTLCIQPK